MGKRELLLALAFVVVGFGVYQFTAPPADPSKPGFSPSKLINEIRREIRGQRESAEGTRTTALKVGDTVREIRLTAGSTAITVVGEDREDVEVQFHVRSTGYDKAEAESLVKATHDLFKSDEAAALLILTVDYPREGRQTGTLTLKVPKRLGFRMDGKAGTLKVSDVASIAIGPARGETTLTNIAGPVAINQRGSILTVSNVGELRLQTAAGAEVRISQVRGNTSMNIQGGEVRAEHLAGSLEVESRNAELRFEHLDKVAEPVRVNAMGGEIVFVGLRTDARIDGRETDVRVEQGGPAPLAIYNSNDGADAIEVTLADAGLKLDAVAQNGSITLDDALTKAGLAVNSDGGEGTPEKRVRGAIRGGGPTITLRATRGDITIKSR